MIRIFEGTQLVATVACNTTEDMQLHEQNGKITPGARSAIARAGMPMVGWHSRGVKQVRGFRLAGRGAVDTVVDGPSLEPT